MKANYIQTLSGQQNKRVLQYEWLSQPIMIVP